MAQRTRIQMRYDTYLPQCGRTERYTGRRRPTCDEGRGCRACWQKHQHYLATHPPKITGEFRVFYDFICQAKRLGQRVEYPVGMYEFYNHLERMIRTGSYRFSGSVLADGLDIMTGKVKPPKSLPPKS